MSLKLLVKYPTRSRPEHFKKALRLYESMCHDKENTEFLITADEDDVQMNTDDIRAFVAQFNNTSIHYGPSKTKIEAINTDLDKARPWDIVLVASDDMLPVRQGYDIEIRSMMSYHFFDMDGALFYNDGTEATKKNLNTLPVLGRKYYDRFGYIYHPAYKSYFCDNEYTEVGQLLGRLVNIPYTIIKHEHPFWQGNFPHDELYRTNDRYWAHDQKLFIKRKSANYGLARDLIRFSKKDVELSILIPTINGREGKCQNLIDELKRQIKALNASDKVEILSSKDNKQMTIGAKRWELYQKANGRYSIQIDDDDRVPVYFLQRILEVLPDNPDCIGYLEECIMDGKKKTCCHSDRFIRWADHVDGFDYVRTIFCKDVIRTDIARQVPMYDVRFGEDHAFSKWLKNSGLLKKEIFINEVMYYYSYNSLPVKAHRERYGIK